jgi:hypothetical protein
MAPLTERQQKAADIAHELAKMRGVWVTSPMPLDDRAKLGVQILDAEREKIITTICEWGWLPAQVQGFPRFTPQGLIPAWLYEIDLPKERPPIPAETKVVPRDYAAERETRKKMEKELELFRKTIRGR